MYNHWWLGSKCRQRKTVVSICIDLDRFVCLETTHLASRRRSLSASGHRPACRIPRCRSCTCWVGCKCRECWTAVSNCIDLDRLLQLEPTHHHMYENFCVEFTTRGEETLPRREVLSTLVRPKQQVEQQIAAYLVCRIYDPHQLPCV